MKSFLWWLFVILVPDAMMIAAFAGIFFHPDVSILYVPKVYDRFATILVAFFFTWNFGLIGWRIVRWMRRYSSGHPCERP
jgi:hypothetical protein